VFPTADSAKRRSAPVTSGFLDYFPLAVHRVAQFSKFGNDKHNPGQPLHWARFKSIEHAENIGRHLMERGTVDPDSICEAFPEGFTHTVALAWRAMALLQKEEEMRLGGYDRDAV
jgi:hypothetical protein